MPDEQSTGKQIEGEEFVRVLISIVKSFGYEELWTDTSREAP